MKQLICTISFIKEHTALQIGDPPVQLLKHSDTTKLISCTLFKMLHLQLDEIFQLSKDPKTVDVIIEEHFLAPSSAAPALAALLHIAPRPVLKHHIIQTLNNVLIVRWTRPIVGTERVRVCMQILYGLHKPKNMQGDLRLQQEIFKSFWFMSF